MPFEGFDPGSAHQVEETMNRTGVTRQRILRDQLGPFLDAGSSSQPTRGEQLVFTSARKPKGLSVLAKRCFRFPE
jgi:hypothetical protein